jgi:hypothetical protein
MKRLTKLAVLGAAAVAAFGIASAEDFTAYLGIQTTNYTFRNSWEDTTYGIEGTDLPEGLTFDSGMIWWNDNDAEVLPCTFTNATIDGNGNYSVSVTGIDWSQANNDSGFNMLFVDTTIDYDGATYDYTPGYFSYMEVLFDGELVYQLDESELEDQSPDYLGLYTLEKSDANELTYCAYNVYGDGNTFDFASMPSEIVINFTVAGLDHDKEVEDVTLVGKEEETPADDADTTDDADTADDSASSDDASAEVTSAADDTASATATPAADSTSNSSSTTSTTDDSSNTGLIIGIVIAVVVVVAIVIVVASKKKKK